MTHAFEVVENNRVATLEEISSKEAQLRAVLEGAIAELMQREADRSEVAGA